MKSSISRVILYTAIGFICLVFVYFMIKLNIGNKQIFDLSNTYDKCIIYIGNEKIELDIKSWKDFDGEQIQIITKSGDTYLVSMNNALLIKEK